MSLLIFTDRMYYGQRYDDLLGIIVSSVDPSQSLGFEPECRRIWPDSVLLSQTWV